MAVTGMTRFGERIGQGAAASFRCDARGEMAGVVKVARAGTGGRPRRNACCERHKESAWAPTTWCGIHARRCRRDRRCPAVRGPAPTWAGVRTNQR